MKTLRNILGNLWVFFGLGAFTVSLAILWRHPDFGREDALSALIIFGIAFPVVAWLASFKVRPLVVRMERSATEMGVLFVCLAGITLYLIWGPALSEALIP